MNFSLGRFGKWLSPRVTYIAAFVAIIAAIEALIIWSLGIDWLRQLFPDQVSMKPNTAVSFLLSGLLMLGVLQDSSAVRNIARWGLAVPILLLNGLTLAQYIFDVDLNIDLLLMNELGDSAFTSSPGRMAPTTAISFILFSVALILDHWNSGLCRGMRRSLATILLIIALTSLLGYAYGAPALYLGLDGVTAMSLPTAIMFLILGIGAIWLRPEYGFPAMVTEQSIAGSHIRALLPMIVGAPLLVGAAVAAGYGEAFEGQFAIALTSLGSVFAASLVATVSIFILRQAESELYIKDRALAATHNGIIITNHLHADEPITFVNEGFFETTGYSADECLGRNCRFLNKGVDNDQAVMNELRACIASGTNGDFEIRNRRKDGELIWVGLSLSPIKNHENVATHFVGVIEDITQKREQASKLQDALGEAKAANTMQNTFVRLISHELRTPLNSALTWIRLMELDHSDEIREKGINVVAESIQSQSRLIDDLVDITRFSSAGVRLESKNVDARELVERTVNELRPMLESNRNFEIEIADDNYTAQIDPLRIQQVARNLLSNAYKYSAAGDSIHVGLSVSDGTLVMAISDSGRGLSKSDVEKMFSPFWRAESEKPGLGVGLTIVAALVAAHSGTIEAVSDGPGQGSTFIVRLPVKASPSGRLPLRDAISAAIVQHI